MEHWTDFFVAQVGASAALLGLLFVSLSINIEKILALPGLASRGLLALMLLLAVLLAGSLMLVPGQAATLQGAEVLAIGAILTLSGGRIQWRAFGAHPGHRLNSTANTVLFLASVLPYLAAGVSLAMGAGHAPYWLAAAMLVSFIKAVTDAWVLLVEINR